MILRDRYDGKDSPFEGDRELVLRHLPADARVVRARATVTPMSAPGSPEPFVETLAFPTASGGAGDWGATKSTGSGWVEVDFHARRTVVGLTGGLAGAVQADLGAGFMPLSDQGTFQVPPQGPLTVSGGSAMVPSFHAVRLRLFGTGQSPDLTAVRVRSAPAGVRLGLRGQPALWFHAGELTRPETTPDFAVLLQAYLDDAAEVADGVFLLPFLLHSDTLGRLVLEVEIEYLRRAGVLTGGVREARLPFDHGGLPRTPGVLEAALPGDARILGAAGRVTGAFEETRIAFGPTGEVAPLGELSVAPGSSPAHPLLLPKAVEAVALDLLLAAASRTARLQLDLRQDLDGKPSGESFLPAPVSFTLDRAVTGHPTWVSVPLPAPFQFRAGQERTYWLVLQSLDGEATWSVEAAAPALPAMQLTQDGGFSWRTATLGPSTHLAGLFRLRTLPATFRMPVELQVGKGKGERRVSLSRFEPLGRVDLSFAELPEAVEAFNQALESAPGRCPETEHLANGGFEQWLRTGRELAGGPRISLQEEDDDEEIPFDHARLAVTLDGRTALVASDQDDREVVLWIVDLDRQEVAGTVRGENVRGIVSALAADPAGGRAWVAFSAGNGPRIWTVDPAGRRAVGEPLLIPTANTGGTALWRIEALALGADGGTLYAALSPLQPSPTVGGRVFALDTRLLEDVALRGELDVLPAVKRDLDLAVLDPAALAVSPDGAWLYVLASTLGQSSKTEVEPIETGSFDRRDDLVVDLGTSPPRALACAPDGRLVAVLEDRVVLCSPDGSSPTESVAVAIGQEAQVAIDVDGSRAFVAGEGGLTVVDLQRGTAAEPLTLGDTPSDVAVTPDGDRVLALIPTSSTLVSISAGTALPAVWRVTAGQVSRFAGAGQGSAVFLGPLPEKREGTESPALPVATSAVSQVVPVAAGCAYELTFRAIASERDAVAEVLWRAGACAVAQTDTVPLAPIEPGHRTARGDIPLLILHRARFQAPAGATQAEIRFRAPAGVLALVDDVSFRATAASVLNSDLQGTGLPEPWQVEPEGATGFLVTAQSDGLRLRNAGTQETAIFQEVELGQGRAFLLEVQGRSLAAATRQRARVEALWLGEEGEEAGPASSWELPAEGFDAFSARGTAPPAAVRAEVRLVVPAGTAVDVRRLDLRFTARVPVPVTFVAQAPGELAVAGWELLYDQVPMTRPPVPATGLCPPEPPPLTAGEEPANGDGCCRDAEEGEAEPEMAAAKPEIMAVEAPARALFRVRSVAVREPVTAIPGIGRGRSLRLKKAGMDSIATLAASSPALLRSVLPGMPEKTAVDVILAARERLRAPR